jgi:hypothetical protein
MSAAVMPNAVKPKSFDDGWTVPGVEPADARAGMIHQISSDKIMLIA